MTPKMQQLDALIRPAVEGQGYELVDLVFARAAGGQVLRVTIDRPPGQGYVGHQDCVRVSREVSALLDVHDVLPAESRYHLEVSSPGIDRPLKKPTDFARFVGQTARVKLLPDATQSNLGVAASAPKDPRVGPRRVFVGAIAGTRGELVQLSVEGLGLVELHTAEVEKASLVLGAMPSQAEHK